MSARFVDVDRSTPLLFPEDLREWLPGNHMVHFIVEVVEGLDVSKFKVNETGSGSKQYPPAMMVTLLLYCYATGRMSSRVIEEATYSDVAVRYICGNRAHPDHSVICRFRTENKEGFKDLFTKVLVMAREMGYLKKVGNISVDGTKIHANASRHSAVSYKRAAEMIAEAEKEVGELLAKAEEADSRPLEAGLTIPEEIRRREDRKAALEGAKREMEKRYEEAKREREEEAKRKREEEAKREREEEAKRKREEEAKRKREEEAKRKREEEAKREREEEVARENESGDSAKKRGGGGKVKPLEKYQYNFTDPESRIMKVGNGIHFEQSYNAQAAVDTETMLVVGEYVTNHANDKRELQPVVESIDKEAYTAETVSADSGFFSEEAVKAVEKRDEKGEAQGPVVYCAVERQSHHRTVKDLEKHEEPPELGAEAGVKEVMARRLKTAEGKKIYKKRKETVEPVFGIIKQAMGFRQFLLRGLEKVNQEWEIVCLGYNLKRLYRLSQG